ncbi:MAG TPA: hypothetical protein VKA54_12585 [Gemmatimonadaceae bacterium]|nr:hypothetical protein [Gemmatimonadaceae bacterium]
MHMRVSLLSIMLVAAGCHSATPQAESSRAHRALAWDSATAYRICESPDSVVAGKKECVLLNQGRPTDRQKFPSDRRP